MRVKKLLKSKLNEGSLMDGLYAWDVGVVHYSTGILDWTKEECLNTDRKPKKIMTMNGCMHTSYNVARLYLPRREGGRGLIEIKECEEREKKKLHQYIQAQSKEADT